MTKNKPEKYFTRYMKIITEGKLWELLYTGRENVKNARVTEDVITCDKTEYSIHSLAEVMDGKHKNDWILIMIYRTGK